MILYFSATGNSKYCAEFIASKTNDKKIISINLLLKDMKDMKDNIYSVDCSGESNLGIIAPVYDLDLAYVVTDFLEKCEFKNVTDNCYTYGVFTCGNMCGISDKTLEKILKKKNINLNAAFAMSMPNNYVLSFFKAESQETVKSHLSQADLDLANISDDIRQKKPVRKLFGKFPSIIVSILKKISIHSQRKVKDFSVASSCISCGLCEKICPMNIIKIKDNHPVWIQDNCACCLGCLNRCPVHAIQRGNSAKNGHYVNPNVKF